MVSIAVHALMGEIAAQIGKFDEGIGHFREALKIEDAVSISSHPSGTTRSVSRSARRC
jgi:hypothetical protein